MTPTPLARSARRIADRSAGDKPPYRYVDVGPHPDAATWNHIPAWLRHAREEAKRAPTPTP